MKKEKNLAKRIYETTALFKSAGTDYNMKRIDPDDKLTLDLFTSEPYRINLVDFLSFSTGVFGATGSGKSITSARILEQISNHRIPFTIFDKEGDYDSLLDYNNSIVVYYFIQDVESNKIEYYKISKWFENVNKSETKECDEEAIKELAKNNFYKGRMVVLDLSMMVIREDMMGFVYTYVLELKKLSDELYRDEIKLQHLIFLDESAYYLPSIYSDFYDKTIKISKPMVALFSSLASMARKRGLIIMLSTQRITHVSNDTLSNLKQFFFHKVSSKPDIQRYKHYCSGDPSMMYDIEEIMHNARPGDAVFVHKDMVLMRRVKMRVSRHLGKTPRPSDTFRSIEKLKKRGLIHDL